MSVDWNKPIETVPCERNPNPVPCEFGGFDGDGYAQVFIRGDWFDSGGRNMRDDRPVDERPWYYHSENGVSCVSDLPAIRNRTPTTQPDPTKTLRDEFAMAALGGFRVGREFASWDDLAADCYEAADAMMNARKEEGDD